MKFYLCLIFLMSYINNGLCADKIQNVTKSDYEPVNTNKIKTNPLNLNIVRANGKNNMRNYNVGNPDAGRIEQPCETHDIDCIRRFFAKNGKCNVRNGPVPNPYYRKRTTVFLPRVNLTVTAINVEIKGLSGRVEQFYINKDTDKVVIAIEFRNLTITSNRTYFRFHRRGKEPVVTKTTVTVTYQSIVATGIIPQINNILLDEMVVFVFVNDAMPTFSFGPTVAESTDPQVQATLAEFQTNPRANVGEIFLTDGGLYPATYIQYNICDFGLKFL